MAGFVLSVYPFEMAPDPDLLRLAHRGGLHVSNVFQCRCYVVDGDIDQAGLDAVARLVHDPLISAVTVEALSDAQTSPLLAASWAIDVAYRPGVTDNEGDSVLLGAQQAGIEHLRVARTVERFIIEGTVTAAALDQFARETLANNLVQSFFVGPVNSRDPLMQWYKTLINRPDEVIQRIDKVPLRDATPAELATLSRTGILALDAAEMLAIQQYFRDLDREPTDGELETIAQTWSEHCSHKTFKALIQYEESEAADPRLGNQHINGLLRQFLIRATETLRPPWLLSAFVDNAGIIAVGNELAVSVKVETHNHPSALEPFGGANTGIGGVIRDILGVSAQPIANIDVLCFGPGDIDTAAVPPGVLHPHRIADGVVSGVRDYGNKLGVPTVSGAVLYDPGYTLNPLVFCGTIGLAPQDWRSEGAQSGDVVVLVGGRTGRDGIHGATFSSIELTHSTAATVGSAVQIGDPITEKKMIDVVLQARTRGLYRAITDCGAGGLSSAVGEMGERTGVRVELDRVPLKYTGLQPWEIWISEAQERMVVAVPPHAVTEFLQLCDGEQVLATEIGTFTNDKRLTVLASGQTLVDVDMDFLHRGIPQQLLHAVWNPVTNQGEAIEDRRSEPLHTLLALLAHPNIASKDRIVRTYDHLVQARTLQGPFVGTDGTGPSDGAVLRLDAETDVAIAVGLGINPWYGLIDPYWMALAACDEAVRNLVAIGGNPRRVAFLDNFCWGDPRQPDRLGGLVRATAGCYDASMAWEMPFISGKDSLNNEYRDVEGKRVPIPPTLLISAVGVVDNQRHTTSSALKEVGNDVYLVGKTKAELGGTHWALINGVAGGQVPRVDLSQALQIFDAVHAAIEAGIIVACHDLSEGGLGVAAAEMVLGGRIGLQLDLDRIVRDDITTDEQALWSESCSRFLVEVNHDDAGKLEQIFAGIPANCIGNTTAQARLFIRGLQGDCVIDCNCSRLDAAWRQMP
ncbi:MAG: phosphoribosylformylglycinamidine synthase subunit PurL [Herpetosiphon sp.]